MNRPATSFAYIGPYSLLRMVGRDARGLRYHAYDMLDQRDALLVVLNLPDGVDSEAALSALQRWIAAMRLLRHPGLICPYAAVSVDGLVLILSDYVAGTPLSEVLNQAGMIIDSDTVLEFGEEIADTLDYLHDGQIYHHELSPETIWLTPDNHAVLVNVALGRFLAGAEPLARGYIAPEILTGGRGAAAADLYSLAAVLFKLLVGMAPLEGGSGQWQGSMIYNPLLARVFERALAAEPTARYANGQALIAALKGAASVEENGVDATYMVRRAVARVLAIPPRVIGLALLVLILLLVVLCVVWGAVTTPGGAGRLAPSVAPSVALATTVVPTLMASVASVTLAPGSPTATAPPATPADPAGTDTPARLTLPSPEFTAPATATATPLPVLTPVITATASSTPEPPSTPVEITAAPTAVPSATRGATNTPSPEPQDTRTPAPTATPIPPSPVPDTDTPAPSPVPDTDTPAPSPVPNTDTPAPPPPTDTETPVPSDTPAPSPLPDTDTPAPPAPTDTPAP